eukprot:3255627-Ditylum_brightwellii.AAC.1
MPTRKFVTFVEYDDSSSNSENGKHFDDNNNDQGCISSSYSSSSRLHYGLLPRYEGPVKVGTKQSEISNYFGKKRGRKRKRGRNIKTEAVQVRWSKAIKIKCEKISQGARECSGRKSSHTHHRATIEDLTIDSNDNFVSAQPSSTVNNDDMPAQPKPSSKQARKRCH